MFTDAELQDPSLCKGDDEFISFPHMDGGEQGIIVYRDGRVTNRFEDGTVGVPVELQDAADDVETLVQVGGMNYADNWHDVYVDEDGNFEDWAETPR